MTSNSLFLNASIEHKAMEHNVSIFNFPSRGEIKYISAASHLYTFDILDWHANGMYETRTTSTHDVQTCIIRIFPNTSNKSFKQHEVRYGFEVQYSVILSSVSLLWPLRPGGTSHQFSSTLEDIQNHVLKGHPGTIKQRGPQPPYKSYTSLLTVVSL